MAFPLSSHAVASLHGPVIGAVGGMIISEGLGLAMLSVSKFATDSLGVPLDDWTSSSILPK